jgi:hypothetical protein
MCTQNYNTKLKLEGTRLTVLEVCEWEAILE